MTKAKVLICGAGIAGISAAYHLAVIHGMNEILLVDERPPLSLTSDKSTECYRNWWPGPGKSMLALMNRSIDLLQELAQRSNNAFHLNQRGYLYLTADPTKMQGMLTQAENTSLLGGGPLRIYWGMPGEPVFTPTDPDSFSTGLLGADLFFDADQLHAIFPYLSRSVVAGLFVRRAGWFSAQQLGAYLLTQAKEHGVKLINARVTGFERSQDRLTYAHLDTGDRIEVNQVINASGPFLKQVGEMMDIELPVFCELHLKMAFRDHLGIIPREAPLLIWNDTQFLPWSEQEHDLLEEDPETQRLLGEFPSGIHTRPEGGKDSSIALILWDYHPKAMEPLIPPPLDPEYPEIALRGLAPMLPELKQYFGKMSRPIVDGGYYTKTKENRPLIGPTPIENGFVIGALSGFGLMAALAAGELLATHLTGTSLPDYAADFCLSRYQDPTYLRQLETWEDGGQL
jgi:glycine/D-amino acid oxidase-like deaminating enzyme